MRLTAQLPITDSDAPDYLVNDSFAINSLSTDQAECDITCSNESLVCPSPELLREHSYSSSTISSANLVEELPYAIDHSSSAAHSLSHCSSTSDCEASPNNDLPLTGTYDSNSASPNQRKSTNSEIFPNTITQNLEGTTLAVVTGNSSKESVELESNKKVYKCKECGKAFSRFLFAKKHCTKKPVNWKCEVCGTTIARSKPSNVKRHRNRCEKKQADIHSAVPEEINKLQEMKCSFCDIVYKNEESLRTHVYKFHKQQEGDFVCSICDFRCIQERYLKKHMTLNHNEGELFQCDLCEYKCKYKGSVTRHSKLVHMTAAQNNNARDNENDKEDESNDEDSSENIEEGRNNEIY